MQEKDGIDSQQLLPGFPLSPWSRGEQLGRPLLFLSGSPEGAQEPSSLELPIVTAVVGGACVFRKRQIQSTFRKNELHNN